MRVVHSRTQPRHCAPGRALLLLEPNVEGQSRTGVTETMKGGFVSMPVRGHLNPMTALARKLQSRGNEVIFIGVPDAEPIVRAADLNFVPFCEKEHPVGSVAKRWGGLAKLHGLDVVEYTPRELMPRLIKPTCQHVPEKLHHTR